MERMTLKEQIDAFAGKWQALDKLYALYARRHGLTYMSLLILEILYDHPDGCTQKYIAEKSYYPKTTVNAVIRKFWQAGYAVLAEMPQDRRNKLVRLTPEGRAYAGRIVGTLWQMAEDAMQTLTAEQRRVMLEATCRYEAELRRRVEVYGCGAATRLPGTMAPSGQTSTQR